MQLAAFGLNHHTAPVHLRERIPLADVEIAGTVVPTRGTITGAGALNTSGTTTFSSDDETAYFTPDADVYANLGAVPGRGREWRLSLKRTF